jgi:predicted amidophosphoribosyltransferase
MLVFNYLVAIIPIPPSNLERSYQPVFLLAEKIGGLTNLPSPTDYLVKTKNTQPLKEISELESRKEELSEAFEVNDNGYRGKYILLFDDLYRSGETLSAASSVLMGQGGVSRVFTLTLT